MQASVYTARISGLVLLKPYPSQLCVRSNLGSASPFELTRVPLNYRFNRPSNPIASIRTLSVRASMDTNIEETVEKIHSTTAKIVLYVCGGAAQAPSWLLSIPGASRSILDVRVPYAQESLTQLLGHRPQTIVCAETALDMAKAAYRQAAFLAPIGVPIIGVAATCALATDRFRRGDHKAFVTTHDGLTTKTYALYLSKGGRSRLQEDDIASRLVVKAIADAMGVRTGYSNLGLHLPMTSTSNTGGEELEAPPSNQEDVLVANTTSLGDHTALLREMLNGRFTTLEFSGAGAVVIDAPRSGRVYLPGSFNPLHDGHREMLAAACRMNPGMEGCYELSIGNADKGWLPIEEIARRVAQFTAAQLPVVLTQAPLFTMKADIFTNSKFVVGYDTAKRLVQAQYYGTDIAMLLQFAKLRHQGCSFLVAGRKDAESGKFLRLEDLEVPELLQRGGLVEGIPESEFRMDISSTELRQKSSPQGAGV